MAPRGALNTKPPWPLCAAAPWVPEELPVSVADRPALLQLHKASSHLWLQVCEQSCVLVPLPAACCGSQQCSSAKAGSSVWTAYSCCMENGIKGGQRCAALRLVFLLSLEVVGLQRNATEQHHLLGLRERGGKGLLILSCNRLLWSLL